MFGKATHLAGQPIQSIQVDAVSKECGSIQVHNFNVLVGKQRQFRKKIRPIRMASIGFGASNRSVRIALGRILGRKPIGERIRNITMSRLGERVGNYFLDGKARQDRHRL